jgi:hypothetical protein
MQVHIAIYKWKDGTTSGQVTEALAKVKALVGKVDGLTAIHVGENTSPWGQGFTHGIVVLGDDEAAIDAYRKHPDHEIVATEIEAIELDGIGIDFGDR